MNIIYESERYLGRLAVFFKQTFGYFLSVYYKYDLIYRADADSIIAKVDCAFYQNNVNEAITTTRCKICQNTLPKISFNE